MKQLAATVILISVAASSLFAQCTGAQSVTITPTPGANCAPGTVYTICYTMSGYNQLGANWVDGFEVILNGPWAPGSLVGTSAPANCNGGGGNWIWSNSVTGTASGQTHGPGYYFDLNPDGNPGNDFGDNGSTCTWSMCFQVTVGNSAGSSISVGVLALSDGEVGSWNSTSCNGSSFPVFSCIIDNPCGTLTANVTQHESCAGNADGEATATMTGGSAPINYSWNTIPVQNTATATGLAAGNYTVTAVDAAGCTMTQTVTVNAGGSSDATINNINATNTVCENDAPIQITTVQGGGLFSGPGVNVSGYFTPANANLGGNTITYSIGGQCPDTQTLNITVLPNADATITDPIPNYPGNIFCVNDPPEQLTAATPGGSWTGNGIGPTGLFNPTVAGVGNHAITYNIPNPCGASDVINITVNGVSDASINNANPTNTFCETDASVQLTTVQGGGTFSGPGVSPTGLFNPSTANIGSNTITYAIGGNCPDTQTMDITVVANADATIDDPIPGFPGNLFCEDDAVVQLTAAQLGGTWTGNGVTPTGSFDPAATGVGNHAITYAIGAPCGDSDVINITVQAVANASINNVNPSNELCENDASVQVTTLQGGGTFSGTGISPTGLFDPSSAALGVNTITYSIAGNCPDSQTLDITVLANADASITEPIPNHPNNIFCENDLPVQLQSAQSGGTWVGPGVSPTGMFDPNTAGVGLHVINYDIPNPCGDNDAINITVDPIADATINNANPTNEFCSTDNAVQLTTLQPGGSFTGPGVSPTGMFDPSSANIGVNAVSYTVGVNCPDTQTMDITVFQQADASITPISATNQICLEASTIQLNATDPGGAWSGNGVNPAGIFDPATAGVGNHTITYTISGPCGDVQTINLVVTSVTLDNSTTESICTADNGSATVNVLTGSAPYTYTWNTVPQQITSTASDLSAGNYDVIVVDNDGCTATSTATVGFDQSNLSGNIVGFANALCNGSCDGTIDATGVDGTAPYQYLWDDPNAQATSQASGLCAGTYNVAISDVNGCTASAQMTITEPTAVSVSGSMDSQSNCNLPDGTASATATGGTIVSGHQFEWNSVPIQSTAAASGLTPGTYTVVAIDDNGCTDSADVVITATPGFATSISTFTDASCYQGCDGTATAVAGLGAIAPVSYAWNSVPNQTGQIGIDLCAGDYQVIITDAVGCNDSAVVTISEPTEVQTQLNSNVTQICIGESANLTSLASGGTGPYTSFSWIADPADVTLVGTQQNPIVTPLVTTNYTLVAEDANGCLSPAQTITINVLDPLVLSVVRPTFNPDTAICPYDFATLDLGATGGDGNYSYFLLPDNLNPISLPMQVQPNSSTTYDFMVTDGCTTPPANASSTVTVHPLPDVVFSGDSLDGCHAHTTIFTDHTSPTPIAWNWNFGDPSSGSNSSPMSAPTHQFSGAGTYDISLSVTTLEGCVSDTVFPQYVEVYPLPYANFTADPERTNLLQSTINFTDESVGNIEEWLWWFGDGDEGEEQHMEHAYLDTGAYLVTLTVTTEHGCEDWTRQQVIIDPDFMFYVPNTFSPNGDGLNDEFRGYGLGVKWDTYELFVYNRWGEEIFYTNDVENSWDGTFKGKDAPNEVYVYKIMLYDLLGESHTYRGRVTIYR